MVNERQAVLGEKIVELCTGDEHAARNKQIAFEERAPSSKLADEIIFKGGRCSLSLVI